MDCWPGLRLGVGLLFQRTARQTAGGCLLDVPGYAGSGVDYEAPEVVDSHMNGCPAWKTSWDSSGAPGSECSERSNELLSSESAASVLLERTILTPKATIAAEEGVASRMSSVSVNDAQSMACMALVNSPICELRDLRVELSDEGLAIRGVVSTFYYKQLAQEAVRAACAGSNVEVVNSIRVRSVR